MLVEHEVAHPVDTSPLRFLLSQYDGFVGWLVLGWVMLMGVGLWWFYTRRHGHGGVNSAVPL
jgi:hypothetical protein